MICFFWKICPYSTTVLAAAYSHIKYYYNLGRLIKKKKNSERYALNFNQYVIFSNFILMSIILNICVYCILNNNVIISTTPRSPC